MIRPSPFTEAIIGTGVVATGLGVVMAVFISRAATAPPPLPKADRATTFDTMWQRAEQIPLARAPFIPTQARVVKIEQIILPTIEPAGPEEVQPTTTQRPRRVATRDICRGKGRVWITKHKWRCKR